MDWEVTSGDTVTSGGLGLVVRSLPVDRAVISGGLGTSYRILRSDWLLSDSQKGHVTL